MVLVGKLSLQNAQGMMDLSSISMETFLAKADLECVKKGKEAGQYYSEMVKGNKEYTLGPPFVHILLASLPELAKNTKVATKHQNNITEYM
eukprot:6355605-Heterocapsa_arctica.AAC.1